MKIFPLAGRVAGCFALLLSVASAGSIRYEFTAGSLAPVLTDVPSGVTADPVVFGTKFQAAGGVSGNLFDEGGGPDSLRITGADGAPDTTGASFTAGSTISFTIHIPAGSTASLKSLSLEYKGTAVSARSDARIYSSIRGHANATNETIGVLGRESGGTDSAWVVDAIDLATPKTNTPWVGSTVQNGDFTNLTGRDVTFEIPWMDGSTASTSFIDLDNLTLNFADPVTPPVVTPAINVTDFRVAADRTSQITFTGESGQPYSIMASPDLIGPVYRKHWTRLSSGNFASAPVVYPDTDAVNSPVRFYVVADSTLPKARIMPVGDSITEGGAGFSVYRQPLFDKLTAAGYRFQYVGSKSTTYNGNTLFHEGFSGLNATQVATQLANHFPSYPADIVLIHAGHNMNTTTPDVPLDPAGEATIVSTVETATRSMVNTCRTVNPKVKILLSQVITSLKLPKYSYIPALNVRLAEVASELNTAVSPVILVSQTGFDPAVDTWTNDYVHPNPQGAEKMATKFFDALVPLLE